MKGQRTTSFFDQSFKIDNSASVSVYDETNIDKIKRSFFQKPEVRVYEAVMSLTFETFSSNIGLYDSRMNETAITKSDESPFSGEVLQAYLIDNNPDVIMPPKKSYYIKAKIDEIVRGKPSKPD